MNDLQLSAAEKDEWQRMARAGAARKRKELVPIAAAVVAFVIVFGSVIFGLGSAWASHDEAREAEKQAILASGGRVVELRTRGSTKESRAAGDGLFLFVIAGVTGAGAAAAAYFALGGRLSAEYGRGLKAFAK